jgi:hypothetical protein
MPRATYIITHTDTGTSTHTTHTVSLRRTIHSQQVQVKRWRRSLGETEDLYRDEVSSAECSAVQRKATSHHTTQCISSPVVLSHSMTLAVLPDRLPDEESRNSASEERQEGRRGANHKLAG